MYEENSRLRRLAMMCIDYTTSMIIKVALCNHFYGAAVVFNMKTCMRKGDRSEPHLDILLAAGVLSKLCGQNSFIISW